MTEDKKRSPRQIEAFIETNVNKLSDAEIIQEIMKDGLIESEIKTIIEQKRSGVRRTNLWFIIGGIIAFLIGILLTKTSYDSVSYSGGDYFVFYGLVITGIVSVIIGIVRMLSTNN